MKPISWKDAAELIGISAILASLIFVAMQLRQEEELLQVEMRAAMVANTVSINQSIIENADVWVRGNNGEELDPAESVIHARLVNNVNDFMFQNRQTFLGIEPQYEEQILAQFAGFLADNPGAYQAWIDRERRLNTYRTTIDPTETITSDWIDDIESRIAILNENARP
jgi:hypothetical protein